MNLDYAIVVSTDQEMIDTQRILVSLGYRWAMHTEERGVIHRVDFFDPVRKNNEDYPILLLAYDIDTREVEIIKPIYYRDTYSLGRHKNLLKLNGEKITNELLTMIVLGYNPFVTATEYDN